MALTARKSHRYLDAAGGGGESLKSNSLDDGLIELDESEVWDNNDVVISRSPETLEKVYSTLHRRPAPVRKKPLRKSTGDDRLPIGQKSLPMNIPDWPKILGGEYRPRAAEGEYEVHGGNDKIPPHEYLARNRVASFSVHEGVGRTLKGRDLSRVRNAIWKKTGFED